MRRTSCTLFCTALMCMTTAAMAQSVDDVLEKMVQADNAGLNDIDNYVLKTNVMGITSTQYFEKSSSLTLDNGQTVYVMRNVPINEIEQRQSAGGGLGDATPEQLDEAARVIRQQGPAMEAGMKREMQSAGLPGGLGTMLMNGPPDKPWLSANPNDMMGMYATMLEAAAEGKRQQAAENPEADTRQHMDDLKAVAGRSRIAGREAVNGRDAIVLVADDLNKTQVADGQEFTLKTLHLWIDAEQYVPLRMQIDGSARDGGETRDLKIVREDSDYRKVAGCGDMYEPFRSVMRVAGVMNEEQEAELAEASKKLEQLDQQMAQMPAAQRDMIMKRMGPQIEMMRNMANGGGLEIETTIAELRCNTGLPDPLELAGTFMDRMPGAGGMGGGAQVGGNAAPNKLVRIIQQHLVTLGYDPGNTRGELTKQTVVAITKFEAASNMEVTGKATPQLAGVLEAAVDAAR